MVICAHASGALVAVGSAVDSEGLAVDEGEGGSVGGGDGRMGDVTVE